MASVDYDIDRAAKRVLIRFVGEVDGRLLSDAMTRLWHEFPEVPHCDSICDMRQFNGNIDYDDISAIAEAWRLFCGGPNQDRRTAIVSRDRFAPLFARAISFCFAGRELAVFRSLEEAQRWLDRTD